MGEIFNCDTRPLVLVVDDDAFVRAEMVEMLDVAGFEVAEADCVSVALAYLERHGDSVSMLLTDLHMPGSRNGATLANHVSFIWPHIHVLVISGAKQPIEGELPYGSDFLRKPLTADALSAYVARFPTDILPHRAH